MSTGRLATLPPDGDRTSIAARPACLVALDIGAREVVSLEEERPVERAGESVGEAIAEVQAGWVPAFAVFSKCIASQPCLFGVYRLEGYLGPGDEVIEITYAFGAVARL